MRGHADLRRRQIEGGLDRDDHRDVLQAPRGEWFVPMPDEVAGPDADDSHHASGRAHQLFEPGVRPFQDENAGARSQPAKKIKNREPNRTYDALQTGTDDEERVQIKDQMERT